MILQQFLQCHILSSLVNLFEIFLVLISDHHLFIILYLQLLLLDIYSIFKSIYIYVTSHTDRQCVNVCLGVSVCIFVWMMINKFIRFLIWMLKMRIVHRQFRLDLQHCTLNLQVSVMVQLPSFLFHVHDDDGFDVLHLMPVVVVVVGNHGCHQIGSK